MPSQQPECHNQSAAALLEKALPLLACPVCHAALAVHQVGTADTILCTGCRRVYPLRDGIPVLIAGEAVEAPQGNAT